MIVIKNSFFRNLIKYAVPFFVIPTIILTGVFAFNEKQYAAVSLLVSIAALIVFISGFEQKKTGTRRLVLTSVMIALAVGGRLIPIIKPVTAIIIITAVYLGGEAGFMCGAITAVISNFYFGQGPWTPFQMLAWGLIGLFAGFLSMPLKKSRILLLLYGLISGIAFSFVMDIWTVLWYSENASGSLYLSAIIAAIPHTAVYAVSNIIFLFVFAKPFGQKIERLKQKYGC